VAQQTKTPAWELALAGGEDFGLCFTARETAVVELATLVAQGAGTRVTAVGEILPPQEGRRLVLPDGRELELGATGWQHFQEDDTS
jgi:thiamine-monophosphate kinase